MGSIINSLIEKGILVSPELMEKEIDESLIKEITEFFGDSLDYLDEEIIENYKKKKERGEQKEIQPVEIIQSYTNPPKKRTYQDFVSVFNQRYENIAAMLRTRRELAGTTTISRIKNNSNDRASIIGMIQDKNYTKNQAIIITLEDPTGHATAIIRKDENNKELYNTANDLALDEVIGVTGKTSGNAVFIDSIIFPDVPLNKEVKRQKEEEYLVCLGDTHFGSKVFLEKEFQKFIDWINLRVGSEEQKSVAKKVKYLVLTGDIVEGVGVYPSQEDDLEIKDITKQYEEAAKWINQIPSHIKIIITTGNHDAGRLSEPQEPPPKEFAGAVHKIPNVTMISNPSYVNIGKTKDFPGFDLLLYHGGSLIYYADNIPSIRSAGGQKRPDLIMKFLLQRRHLAPTHGSTLYLPDAEKDYLMIDLVPDFLITGHIHRSSVSDYRGVMMINASCWTETTDDQIKRGLEPLPARVTIINLKTMQPKIMNYLSKEAKEKEKIKQANQTS